MGPTLLPITSSVVKLILQVSQLFLRVLASH